MAAPTNFQATPLLSISDLEGRPLVNEHQDNDLQAVLQQLLDSSTLDLEGPSEPLSFVADVAKSALPAGEQLNFLDGLPLSILSEPVAASTSMPILPQPGTSDSEVIQPAETAAAGMQLSILSEPVAASTSMPILSQSGTPDSQVIQPAETAAAGMQLSILNEPVAASTSMPILPQPGTSDSEVIQPAETAAVGMQPYHPGMQPYHPGMQLYYPGMQPHFLGGVTIMIQPSVLLQIPSMPIAVAASIATLPQSGTFASQTVLPAQLPGAGMRPSPVTVDANYINPKSANTYCTFCKRDFPKPVSLHFAGEHASEEKPYHCILCPNKCFRKVSGLKAHYESLQHSGGQKKYFCGHCGTTLSRINKLKSHMKTFGHLREGISYKGLRSEALFDKTIGPDGIQTEFTLKPQYRSKVSR
ncbi:MAG: hypothetical protein SP1CHLAM42_09340 [Chlamydiales bacterium]|nr:hypothetical protein [Chlamydiales bacterium]